MKTLEQRIADFAEDPEQQLEALALIKVGRDQGDSYETIMSRVIASILLRFHKISLTYGDS